MEKKDLRKDEFEKSLYERLMKQARNLLASDRYEIFQHLMERLAEIQIPNQKEGSYSSSFYHGINVADICLLIKPDLSEALLIAAVGHDWDRSCGDKRVVQTDFPDTKAGYAEYKKQHAQNSANLFCEVMKEFYEPDLVAKVYQLILLHEVGGSGDLEILDRADGLGFFMARSSNNYRLNRSYAGPMGVPLTGSWLELARQDGYARKVTFMTETMSAVALKQVKELVRRNLDDYHPTVKKELCVLLGIK